MSINENKFAVKRLLGQWSAIENRGQVLTNGVLMQTFTDDGKLICVIQDGDEATTLNCEYYVAGEELVIDGPKEYANPNHVRLQFWFDGAGDLMTDDGEGGRSRFRRV